MQPGYKQRYDHEYRRNGTAVNFIFCEPLRSWRKVSVRQSKKMIDWAEEIRELLNEDYPEAKKWFGFATISIPIRLPAFMKDSVQVKPGVCVVAWKFIIRLNMAVG